MAGAHRMPKAWSPKKYSAATPSYAELRTARMAYCTNAEGVYGPPSTLRPGKACCKAPAVFRNWPFVPQEEQNSMRTVLSCLLYTSPSPRD